MRACVKRQARNPRRMKLPTRDLLLAFVGMFAVFFLTGLIFDWAVAASIAAAAWLVWLALTVKARL